MFFSITKTKPSLRTQVWIFRLLLIAIAILVVSVLVSKNLTNLTGNSKPKQSSNVADMPQVLTKSAVEHLVEQAAKQRYIQDVFDANPKLPLAKKPIPLQPNSPNSMGEATVDTPTQPSTTPGDKHMSDAAKTQRCNYNNQLYVVGDIVKSPQGWVRCTPTLTFSSGSVDPHWDRPAWISVQ